VDLHVLTMAWRFIIAENLAGTFISILVIDSDLQFKVHGAILVMSNSDLSHTSLINRLHGSPEAQMLESREDNWFDC
jgi:hypothetical protein